MKFISKHSEIKMPETKNKAKRHKTFESIQEKQLFECLYICQQKSWRPGKVEKCFQSDDIKTVFSEFQI